MSTGNEIDGYMVGSFWALILSCILLGATGSMAMLAFVIICLAIWIPTAVEYIIKAELTKLGLDKRGQD